MTPVQAFGAGILGIAAGPVLAHLARASLVDTRLRIPTVPVVVASGALGAAFGARYAGEWELPAYIALAGTAIVVSAVDLVELRIPNRVLGPGGAFVAALLGVAAIGEHDAPAAVRAAAWGLAAGAAFLVLHLLSPRSLGMGDVKLAALLGLALGWQGGDTVLLGLLLTFGAGALVAAGLLFTGRVRGRDPLPFGPFLAAGSLGALLVAGGA